MTRGRILAAAAADNHTEMRPQRPDPDRITPTPTLAPTLTPAA